MPIALHGLAPRQASDAKSPLNVSRATRKQSDPQAPPAGRRRRFLVFGLGANVGARAFAANDRMRPPRRRRRWSAAPGERSAVQRGRGSSPAAWHRKITAIGQLPLLRCNEVSRQADVNGMDRPRSRPEPLFRVCGACQEKEHHHASRHFMCFLMTACPYAFCYASCHGRKRVGGASVSRHQACRCDAAHRDHDQAWQLDRAESPKSQCAPPHRASAPRTSRELHNP